MWYSKDSSDKELVVKVKPRQLEDTLSQLRRRSNQNTGVKATLKVVSEGNNDDMWGEEARLI